MRDINLAFSPESPDWDWMVVSRYDQDLKPGQTRGAVAMIIVHKDKFGADLEVEAGESIGRKAIAYDLRDLDKWQRRALLERVGQYEGTP